MFTGLVEEVGRIERIEPSGAGSRLWVTARTVLGDAKVGASIAVDGCCLTAVELGDRGFAVDAVAETLQRTTLAQRRPGDPVNLERSLKLDERLGGHLVQGHVDGVGEIVRVIEEPPGRRVTLRVPPALARFVAEKGSLTVDGVSLTVAACDGDRCEIAYVPHTLAVTTAGGYGPGRRVNVEVDVIARYVARLLAEAGGIGRDS